MPNLTHRSDQPEMLDADFIEPELLYQNLRELNIINTLLGGHAITVKGLKALAGRTSDLSICEIGCGGGDNLAALQKANPESGLRFIGIDMKEDCIAYARGHAGLNNVRWETSDYRQVVFDIKSDVIFSSLFCHHFTDEQLIEQLRWMNENVSKGFFINDLHRHPLAYYSIRWLTKIFSKSPLVKNDAPLSVARGFKRKEWKILLEKAGIENAEVRWCWAFRWLIIVKK